MVTYIYFVKCPNCEDEHFDFFDEAKGYAMGCLSQKPVITQTEVCRNDFGECTDHCDLGTVWSWEDAVGKETDAEPAVSVFTKDDLKNLPVDQDPEFAFEDDDFRFINEELLESFGVSFKNKEDQQEFSKLCSEIGIITAADLKKFMDEEDATDGNLLDKLRAYRADLGDDFEIEEACERKPVPEGMTIEQLVETMQANEDVIECAGCEELFPKDECFHKEGIGWLCGDCEDRIVRCTWCDELYDRSECRKEVDLGWLCSRCEMAIKSRGETLTFREGSYWDDLDENLQELSFSEMVTDSINHLVNDLGKDSTVEDFADEVIADIENNYDVDVPADPEKYRDWASAIACEVSRQLNNPLAEEVEEVHDLGNTYDGGYPEDELEDAETYRSRLELCPECGDEHSYDKETNFCINCGFN